MRGCKRNEIVSTQWISGSEWCSSNSKDCPIISLSSISEEMIDKHNCQIDGSATNTHVHLAHIQLTNTIEVNRFSKKRKKVKLNKYGTLRKLGNNYSE
uniref:Transposase n=1 Tax=Heterorhabditis bacteriophora TaxID=37862 RepID=A0A1I7WHV3_HETBA